MGNSADCNVTIVGAGSFMALLGGDINLREYLGSIGACKVEAVFNLEDPLPGLIEILLVPYLAFTKGF
jgi:predicted ATP-grasp superfamily ATP-dependent carboligase